ncbi:MAG: hypothetical protein EOM64_06440 [Erysipelotrichia bacterium]|nr:hypothetical protein [Erysipelotrichia bacterium]
MILLILLVLLLQRIAHRKTKLWQWMGLVGASAGYLMMISAPGNSVRASEFTSSGGLVYNLIHDFTDSLDVLFSTNYTMHWLFLIYAAVLIAVVYNKRRNQDTLLSLCWIICGIAAVFAIILTPVQVVYDRSMFGASIFVIIAIGICFHRFLQNAALSYHTLTAVFTGVLAVFTCFNLLYTTADLIYTRYQYHKRESYIDAQKEAGNINPVIPLYDREFTNAYNPIYGLGDITIFQDFWTNQSFAKMHELNTISCSTPEQWSKIYQYGDPYLMNIQDMSEYLSAVFENDRYTALVNCSTLDIKQYSSEISILRNFGLNLENQTNFIAVIEKGNISMLKHGNSWLEGYGSIGNYDYYISSGADGLLSDILIDNVEYTNDNPGITIAVFDTEENRIADSVTWNEENETVCTRYMHGT